MLKRTDKTLILESNVHCAYGPIPLEFSSSSSSSSKEFFTSYDNVRGGRASQWPGLTCGGSVTNIANPSGCAVLNIGFLILFSQSCEAL